MNTSIRVKFVGFWPGFDENDNFILNSLKKHNNPVISDNPEVLFSSCFSDEHLKYNCVKVFFTGENECPDFNLFDYALGFEYLDYGDRYLRFPLYQIPELYGEDYGRMLIKHINISSDFLASKPDFCSFVVSNGTNFVNNERTDFFNLLSQYKKVNSGGRYMNNIGLPEGVKDKLAFQATHKFSIAFENSSHPGYTTEKLVQAFAAKSIPIYWGDPCVSKVFNNKAFINCHDYSSFDEVVELIKKIDSNNDIYLDYMRQPALIDESIDYMGEFDKFLLNIVKFTISGGRKVNYLRFGTKYLEREQEKNKLYILARRKPIKYGMLIIDLFDNIKYEAFRRHE